MLTYSFVDYKNSEGRLVNYLPLDEFVDKKVV